MEFDSNTFIVPTEPVQRQLKSFQYCEYDASRSPVGPTAYWLYCGDWSGAMTKRTRLICWIVILFALVGGIVWWQLAKLSKGLRTMPVRGAGEVLVGALSSKVLAPGVDGNPSLAQGTEPILDQYREKPELSHQRYLLVMTWVGAQAGPVSPRGRPTQSLRTSYHSIHSARVAPKWAGFPGLPRRSLLPGCHSGGGACQN